MPWTNGVIPYVFEGPGIDDAFKAMARQAMDDWTVASHGFITFVNVTDQVNPPVNRARIFAGASAVGGMGPYPGPYASFFPGDAYHELGHLIGLPHEFNRYDRDHYMAMVDTQTYGCEHLRCPVADDPFGPFSFRSTMQYLAGYPDFTRWDFSGLCSGQSCSSASAIDCVAAPAIADDKWFTPVCTTCPSGGPQGIPTRGDVSNVIEKYRFNAGWWDKFRRTTVEPTTRVPYPSTLVPGSVSGNVAGGVALADDPATGQLTMYARGAGDSSIYGKTSLVTAGQVTGWTDWTNMSFGSVFDRDPAAVSWPDGTKAVVGRTTDGNIRYAVIPTNSPSYLSIGAPSTGVASSPAVTSRGQNKLDVFIRGNDNGLYWKSLSGGTWSAWTRLGGTSTFRGKPAAIQIDSATVEVYLHGTDDKPRVIKYASGTWGTSFSLVGATMTGLMAWKSSCPTCTCQGADCFSPAASTRGANVVDLIIRGRGDLAWIATRTGTTWSAFAPLGGVLASSPATVTRQRIGTKIDLVTTMDEERTFNTFVPTVWWKQYPQARRTDAGVFLGQNWSGTGSTSEPPDWDGGFYKGTCPSGWGQLGMSDSVSSTGPANSILCRQVDPDTFTGNAIATLALPGEQRRATRTVGGTTDWSYGYWKLECGNNEYVSGSSMSTSNEFHAIRCTQSNTILKNTGCNVRVFDNGESDGAPDDGDWDYGFYKGECAPNEYVAGVSASTTTRRPHSLLCCPR